MQNQTVFTEHAPAPIGPYVQAAKTGNLLFVSGQLGLDNATGELPDCVVAQAENAMKNLCAILNSQNLSTKDIVKTTLFLTDMNDFAAVNEVYGKAFADGAFPARSCIQVAALPKGGKVEVEAIVSC